MNQMTRRWIAASFAALILSVQQAFPQSTFTWHRSQLTNLTSGNLKHLFAADAGLTASDGQNVFVSFDGANWATITNLPVIGGASGLSSPVILTTNTFWRARNKNLTNWFPFYQQFRTPPVAAAFGRARYVVEFANDQVLVGEELFLPGRTYRFPALLGPAPDDSGPPEEFQVLAFLRDRFVAIAGNRIASSLNGEHWEQQYTASRIFPLGEEVRSAAFGNNIYVVVGSKGSVSVSTDLLDWHSHALSPASLSAVTYDFGQFIAVGALGGIYQSMTGLQWEKFPSAQTNNWNSVASWNNRFFVAGDDAAILSSPSLTPLPDTNAPPVLDSVPKTTLYEQTPLSLQLSAHDSDSTNLSFQLSFAAPSGVSLGETNGLLTWTPSESQNGSYQFQVRVFDSGSPPKMAAQMVNIIVLETNVPVKSVRPLDRVLFGELDTNLSYDDPDYPQQYFWFELLNAPSTATLEQPGSSHLLWSPQAHDFFQTRSFEISVQEMPTNSAPQASTNAFQVRLLPSNPAIPAPLFQPVLPDPPIFAGGTFYSSPRELLLLSFDGTIYSSTNGSAWTAHQTRFNGYASSFLAFEPDYLLFDGRLRSSADLNSWTTLHDEFFYRAAQGNGTVVGITDWSIVTSHDLTNWEANFTLSGGLGIAFANNKFVMIGKRFFEPANYVAVSTNGLNWESAPFSFFGTFESFNSLGDEFLLTTSSNLLRSRDGLVWESFQVPPSAYPLLKIDGKYLALSTAAFLVSTNLVTWSEVPLPIASYLWVNSLAKWNDRHYAIAENGDLLSADSLNGNWQSHRFGPHGWITAIAYGNDRFLALSASSELLFSPDGSSWQFVPTPPEWLPLSEITDLAFGAGTFVANVRKADGSCYIADSRDGITWRSQRSSYSINKVSFAGGTSFFTTYNPDGLLSSRDLASYNWQPLSLGHVAFGNGKFVARLSWESVACSTDALSWTTVSAPEITPRGAGQAEVLFGKDRFFVPVNGGIADSQDASKWQLRSYNDDIDFFTGLFINGTFFVHGRYRSSPNDWVSIWSYDGETWFKHQQQPLELVVLPLSLPTPITS